MNNKPVWLEAALEGAALICRDGSTAYVRYVEEKLHPSPQLVGVVIPAKGKPRLQARPLGGGDDEPLLYDFDIIGLAPPVFESWHLVNPEIKFLAKDWAGHWFGFSLRPQLSENLKIWACEKAQDYTPARILPPDLFPECDWQHSLSERPREE